MDGENFYEAEVICDNCGKKIEMNMERKGQAAMEFLMTYGWAVIAAIIAFVVLWYFVFSTYQPEEKMPEFCLIAEPLYILSCNVDNKTITATSNQENLNMALTNNNCSVVGRQDQVNIIYCYEEINLTKYKISLSRWYDE